MNRVVLAGGAEFLDLQPVLILLLVLRGRVIPILTVHALQGYDFSHRSTQKPLLPSLNAAASRS